MKNTWLVWVVIVGIFIGVLFMLNYQGGKHTVPLSEIFKDEKAASTDVEYEFVSNTEEAKTQEAKTQEPAQMLAPVETKTTPAKVTTAATTTAAKTQVAMIEPANSSAPEITHAEMKKVPFTIQISSFKDKAKAEKIVVDLANKGYNPYIVSMSLGEKGIWYRVYVGKFDTKMDAETTLAKVKPEYKDSFIISPKATK